MQRKLMKVTTILNRPLLASALICVGMMSVKFGLVALVPSTTTPSIRHSAMRIACPAIRPDIVVSAN
jgi:hypothetical protein